VTKQARNQNSKVMALIIHQNSKVMALIIHLKLQSDGDTRIGSSS
jgi:hypothetical protein